MSDLSTSLDSQWEEICTLLKADIGDLYFKNWIKPLRVVDIEDNEARLAVPTRFIRDWVSVHYLQKIQKHWSKINPDVETVDLIILDFPSLKNEKTEAIISESIEPYTEEAQRPPQKTFIISNEQDDKIQGMAALDPRFTFENFVVGKPNELAYAAAQRVSDAKEVTFNPLFLYGGVGLGKTHLMHAIAWQIRRNNPNRRVLYLSAEKFMYQFIRSLRFKDTMAFKEQFRSVDVLMIDDVQFIGGKESTQEEFFHTFNALVDQNRQVIISADKSPSDLEGMEERLKSRLGWGLVADIHPTTYELRLGILQAKSEKMGYHISEKVMEFLAHRINSSVRELEGALNRIIAHSQLVGREITLETTQDVLRDLLRANDRRVTIEDIQRKVAEHYKIKMSDMSSSRRVRAIARPRQVAMYLAKHLTDASLPEIGRKFGGRDHTTVMHAIDKVDELMASDKNFSEDVVFLKRMMEA